MSDSHASTIPFDEATRDDTNHLIRLALTEDLGSKHPEHQSDITTESVVPEHVKGQASFVSREQGILCGIRVVELILRQVNKDIEWTNGFEDGDTLKPGDVIGHLRGKAQDILIAERTCLNFLGRLSGISTLTHRFLQKTHDTNVRILDTRKTTPGWRRLEKYAVRCGGGTNHRMGLFDAVLIKDNHLAMLDILNEAPMEEIPSSIGRARAWISAHAKQLPEGQETIVQIEVDRLDQFEKALEYSPDIVLLDNMSNEQLVQAVTLRNQINKSVQLEASGGVNLDTIGAIARTGVDRISVGALTHSAVNFDIGLDWKLEPQ